MKWLKRWRHLSAEEIRRPVEYLVIERSVRRYGEESVAGHIPRQVVEEELGIPVKIGRDCATWFNDEQSRQIHEHPLFVPPERWVE